MVDVLFTMSKFVIKSDDIFWPQKKKKKNHGKAEGFVNVDVLNSSSILVALFMMKSGGDQALIQTWLLLSCK